jgi:hypothetical protein
MDLAGIDHEPAATEDTQKLLNTSAPVVADAPSRSLDQQPGASSSLFPAHHQQQSSLHQSAAHLRKKYRHYRAKRGDKQRPTPGLVKRDVIAEDTAVEAAQDLAILDNCVNKEIERTAEQVVLMQGSGVIGGGVGGGVANSPGDQENCNPRLSVVAPKLPSPLDPSSKTNHRVRPMSSPVVLPTAAKELSVSPHHQRRHRHRDKQHQRAMQQVAAWIEREHSTSPVHDPMAPPKSMCPASMLPSTKLGPAGEHILIQRHEHHHIHEHHHHHHYHHYHET